MVGDWFAIFGAAGDGGEQAVADQAVQELGVVEDVVVPVKVGVLVAQRVEAVRAGGNDLALPLGVLGEGLVKGCHVFRGQHLEEELVASAAGGVAGAGFTLGEHSKLHPRGVQQLHYRAAGAAAGVVKSACAAHPEQVLKVTVANLRDLNAVAAGLLDPRSAFRLVAAPWIALDLKVLKQAPQLAGELRFGEHLVAAHVGNVVNVLNVHRALLHAGAAVSAGPQGVLVGDELAALGVQKDVAQVRDQQLGA